MLTPEEYLKRYCELDDWDKITDENVNDKLWTNNVIKYMEGYAKMAIYTERQPYVEKIEAILNKHSELVGEPFTQEVAIRATRFDYVAEAILNSFEKTEERGQKIK